MRFETQGWDLTFKGGGGEEGNEKEEKISHMSKSSAQNLKMIIPQSFALLSSRVVICKHHLFINVTNCT